METLGNHSSADQNCQHLGLDYLPSDYNTMLLFVQGKTSPNPDYTLKFYHILCQHIPNPKRKQTQPQDFLFQTNSGKTKSADKRCQGALTNGHGFGFLIAF